MKKDVVEEIYLRNITRDSKRIVWTVDDLLWLRRRGHEKRLCWLVSAKRRFEKRQDRGEWLEAHLEENACDFRILYGVRGQASSSAWSSIELGADHPQTHRMPGSIERRRGNSTRFSRAVSGSTTR